MWEAAELWVSQENRTDTSGHEAEQANHQKFSKSGYKPGDHAELGSAQLGLGSHSCTPTQADMVPESCCK